MKLSIRPPKLRITKTGVHLQMPTARIGNENAGLNLSSHGANVSVGPRGAKFNTKRGLTINPFALLGWLFGKKK